jgi:endogenous inhibitor of DNA gyrase (YacG/DUF329 family)
MSTTPEAIPTAARVGTDEILFVECPRCHEHVSAGSVDDIDEDDTRECPECARVFYVAPEGDE